MRIVFDDIVLRDYQISDVEDEARWTNVDTDWFYADTPWMKLEPVDPDELRSDMLEIISDQTDDIIRWRFEIEYAGRHIGMVSSYYLDDDYEPTPWESIVQTKNADDNHAVRALGIEICEMDYWGKGIGPKVLSAFMNYYRGLGEHRFIVETWSGNTRMIGCARKLGFVEVGREIGAYVAEGMACDKLVLEKSF